MPERKEAIVEQFDPNDSMVKRFLTSQCKYTPFEQDYIVLKDLEEAYDSFCSNFEEGASNRETLIGSPALAEFGTRMTHSVEVEYLHGIMKNTNFARAKSEASDFIRRPLFFKTQKKTFLNEVKYVCKKERKRFNNYTVQFIFVWTFLNFLSVLIVPIPYISICYGVFTAPTFVQKDIYGKFYNHGDLAYASKKEPWWNEVPNIEYFFYFNTITVFFYFVSLLDFISHIAVGN